MERERLPASLFPQHHDLVRVKLRDAVGTLTRFVVTVTALVLLLVAVVLSPLGLLAVDDLDSDWTRMSNMGQTYGVGTRRKCSEARCHGSTGRGSARRDGTCTVAAHSSSDS
ncbi:hypothetical protein [Plantactinospora sp. WMMB782]|uniref:hypothetical protein n=1 Tax=Plantactinospora sp. WMMB782 TaxID=3404121 RepID=UPI003B93FFC9